MVESQLVVSVTPYSAEGVNRYCGRLYYLGKEVVRAYGESHDGARTAVLEFALVSLLEKTLELDGQAFDVDQYARNLKGEIGDLRKECANYKNSSSFDGRVAQQYKKLHEEASWIAEERRLAYLEQVAYIEYLQGRLSKKRIKFVDEDAFAQSRNGGQS